MQVCNRSIWRATFPSDTWYHFSWNEGKGKSSYKLSHPSLCPTHHLLPSCVTSPIATETVIRSLRRVTVLVGKTEKSTEMIQGILCTLIRGAEPRMVERIKYKRQRDVRWNSSADPQEMVRSLEKLAVDEDEAYRLFLAECIILPRFPVSQRYSENLHFSTFTNSNPTSAPVGATNIPSVFLCVPVRAETRTYTVH